MGKEIYFHKIGPIMMQKKKKKKKIGSVSGPVPDPETHSLEVRYRILSQSYEDCLRVREYITMNIYWIISLSFHEILFCDYEIFENDLNFENLCLLCYGYALN